MSISYGLLIAQPCNTGWNYMLTIIGRIANRNRVVSFKEDLAIFSLHMCALTELSGSFAHSASKV